MFQFVLTLSTVQNNRYVNSNLVITKPLAYYLVSYEDLIIQSGWVIEFVLIQVLKTSKSL